MRLFNNLASLIFLAALASACSKNSSVEDDWPGIDEIVLENEETGPQALLPGDSFTLKSKLTLPKMGKDVSYTIETVCRRALTKRNLKKIEYTKFSSFEASKSPNQSHIHFAELIAPEVLIFPEFFKSCDVKLTAENGIGSTQASELKDLKMDFDVERDRDLVLGSTTKRYGSAAEMPFTNRSIKNTSINSKNNIPFSTLRRLCYNKGTVKTSDVISSTIAKLSNVSGRNFKIIPRVKDHPLEKCIVASISSENIFVSSNKFKVLTQKIERPSVQVSDDLQKYHDSKQVFYSDSETLKIDGVLTVSISSNSNENIKYKFDNLKHIQHNTKVIVGMNETSYEEKYGDAKSNYEYIEQKMPYKMFWSSEQQGITNKVFKINVGETKFFNLSLDLGFKCRQPEFHESVSAELGFLLKIMTRSDAFTISSYIEDDFNLDQVDSFSLLDQYDSSYTVSNLNPYYRTNNRHYLIAELLFRNNTIHPGEQLRRSHTKMSPNPTDDSHTFKMQNYKPKHYPFDSYDQLYANKVTCESTFEN